MTSSRALVAYMIVSVRVKRLRKRAARGSCCWSFVGCVNLAEMCVNMWYLGSLGEAEKMRLTIGAARARPGGE
jgi:hypothetical protein